MNNHLKDDTNLLNLNNNLLVAVEIITTGPSPRKDSMIQVCFLPLNAELKPHKGVLPFYCDLQPARPDTIDWDNLPHFFNRDQVYKATQNGIPGSLAADRFDDWFRKFEFQQDKRLFILSHNYPFKRAFIEDWLGSFSYSKYFSPFCRDLIPAALFANDKADHNVEQIPFPKVNIAFICSCLKVSRDHTAFDALQEALVFANCYKKMLSMYIH